MSTSNEAYNARKRRNYENRKEKANAATRAWQARNAEHLANYARTRKLRIAFGMTPAAYEALLGEQNGHCAMCPKTPAENGRRLAVDHNHTTGKVRGLLCSGCNTGIGNLHEDIGRFHAGVAYLLRHL